MNDIPIGYAYIRCDIYTPAEFLEKYEKMGRKEECKKYMNDHPKDKYNTDDEIAIHYILGERYTPGLLHGQHRSTTKKTWYTDR